MATSQNSGAQKLTESALATLAARVDVPTYNRRQLGQGIVHVGVGQFARAHSAVYLDDLAHRGITTDWGVRGVGLLPRDRAMLAALTPQQCLYTVVTRSAEVDRARVVGSLIAYLFAPDDPEEVLGALSDARTRLVTLTITEGGYNVDQATGQFDAANPDVQHDLRIPSRPMTVFGYLCEALDRRRRAGLPPVSVFSLDNLQSNGALARKALLSFASLRDESLSSWIAANVAFPCCMVDRITPGTTDADRELVEREFGIIDAWPVMCEPFRQWIVEDTFCNGRPPLEEVGVQLTANVHPYEMMKLRLLNASHSAMGYLGHLAGHRYIHDVVHDRVFWRYIERLMDDEVTPLLPPVPGVNLDAYKRTLLERFANPKIKDQVARICSDGSAKVPKFLLPSITEALTAGRPHELLTLAVAGWFRYLRGTDEQGGEITIQDPLADTLRALACQGNEDPRPLLGLRTVFGDLVQNETWVTSLQEALRALAHHGTRTTLSRLLAVPGA